MQNEPKAKQDLLEAILTKLFKMFQQNNHAKIPVKFLIFQGNGGILSLSLRNLQQL